MSQILINSLTPSQGYGGEQVVINGFGFSGLTEIRFGNTVALSTFITDSRVNAISPYGSGTSQVTVITSNGISNEFPFVYLEPSLVVTEICPTEGSVNGGDLVTILGSGFTQVTSVKFGTNSAVTTFLTDSKINAISPPGTGIVDLIVSTPNQSASQQFTYLGTPILNSLNPDNGPSTGGTTIQIAGQNLTDAISVKFGNQSASFQIISDILIEAISPPGLGTVPVTVTTPAGLSNELPFIFILACLSHDTRILMANGQYKNIQNIIRGDIVAGDLQLNKKYTVARALKNHLPPREPIDIMIFDKDSLGHNLPDHKLIVTINHSFIWTDKRRPAKCFVNYPGVKKEFNYVFKALPVDNKGYYCVYDLQFETLGSFVANGIIMQSRSPRSNLTPLPLRLYFHPELYQPDTGEDDIGYEFPLDLTVLDN